MRTMLLSKLMLYAEALDYDLPQSAGVSVILKDAQHGGTITFNANSTYEGNLRVAIAWCESFERAQGVQVSNTIRALIENIQVPVVVEGTIDMPVVSPEHPVTWHPSGKFSTDNFEEVARGHGITKEENGELPLVQF